MKRTILFFSILLSLSGFDVFGQNDFCAYDQVENYLNSVDPSRRDRQIKTEERYRNFIRDKYDKHGRSSALVTLPVVVHIVHSGTGPGASTHPTDEQIRDVITSSSARFRHSHQGHGMYQNPHYGADTEIEFCLVTEDPDGNFTTGIIRHYSAQYATGDYQDVAAYYAANYAWDQERFYNVFLMEDLSNAAGVYIRNSFQNVDFTIFNASSFWDGLFAHETGHYLSLAHTFEIQSGDNPCANHDCLMTGDKVCDTPVKDGAGWNGASSCDEPSNSCNTDEEDASNNNPYRSQALGGMGDQPDMLSNYMDYTGGCWDAFTEGQKARMQFNLVDQRQMLTENAMACGTPQTPALDASIEFITPEVFCSEIINPLILLKNKGVEDVSNVTLQVYLDSIMLSDSTYQVNDPQGDNVISLDDIQISGGSHSLVVKLTAVNGITDDDQYNNINGTYFNFQEEGIQEPVFENFESDSIFLDNEGDWAIGTNSSLDCLGAFAVLQRLSQISEDVFRSMRIDLSSIENPELTFTMSCLPHIQNMTNSLQVLASVDCGAPVLLHELSGLALATNTPPAFMTNGSISYPDCSQLRTETIDLSPLLDPGRSADSDVEIIFVANGVWINPLILDDISINQSALPVELSHFEVALTHESAAEIRWTTASEINTEFFEVQKSSDGIEYSAIGQVLATGSSHESTSYRILDKSLQSGTYYYRLRMVDLDGSFAYSSVQSIENQEPDISGITYLMDEQLLKIPSRWMGKNINIYNALGQQILTSSISSSEFELSEMGHGIFFYQIQINDREHIAGRFIKS